MDLLRAAWQCREHPPPPTCRGVQQHAPPSSTFTAGLVPTAAGAACDTLTACTILNVGPDNSLSTGPACQLTGMVTQGPHHRRHPEALALLYEASYVILRSTVSSCMVSSLPLWLECTSTSITIKQKICQTTSRNISKLFYVLSPALTLPEINSQSLSVHT